MADATNAERPLATATRQLENDRLFVTEWRFPPYAQSGWHRHEHEFVVIPITSGHLHLETPDGPMTAELVAGQAYTRARGTEHNVISDSETEIVFLEVEIKG